MASSLCMPRGGETRSEFSRPLRVARRTLLHPGRGQTHKHSGGSLRCCWESLRHPGRGPAQELGWRQWMLLVTLPERQCDAIENGYSTRESHRVDLLQMVHSTRPECDANGYSTPAVAGSLCVPRGGQTRAELYVRWKGWWWGCIGCTCQWSAGRTTLSAVRSSPATSPTSCGRPKR